jgi:hypothetical protein
MDKTAAALASEWLFALAHPNIAGLIVRMKATLILKDAVMRFCANAKLVRQNCLLHLVAFIFITEPRKCNSEMN